MGGFKIDGWVLNNWMIMFIASCSYSIHDVGTVHHSIHNSVQSVHTVCSVRTVHFVQIVRSVQNGRSVRYNQYVHSIRNQFSSRSTFLIIFQIIYYHHTIVQNNHTIHIVHFSHNARIVRMYTNTTIT